MHFILEGEEKEAETPILRKFSPTEKLEGAIPTRITFISDTSFKFSVKGMMEGPLLMLPGFTLCTSFLS